MKTEGKAPQGTWNSAYLVTNYMAVENRLVLPGNAKRWARPRSPRPMAKLRRRLIEAKLRQGIVVIADAIEPRPGAGQPLAGPLPMPEPRPRRAAPIRVLPIRQDFRVPDEALTRPGMDWYFRSGLNRRPALTPSWVEWPLVGLEAPGKGA